MLKRESARDWMKARIAHSLPGRLRLVVPGLEYIQAERRGLAAELAGIAGVRRARINVPTAGVLLEYDPSGWTPRPCWSGPTWSSRSTP